MLKKYLVIIIVIAISSLSIQPPALAQTQDKGAKSAEQVKADVAAIGAGARVQVRLRAGGRLTGYIGEVGENGFVLTKAKEGSRQTVAYAEVERVRVKNEKKVSTAGKVLIIFGVMWVVGIVATGGGG
ncbi:MAG: hypothetical protein ACJ754_12455 [Pyrinomonadaceae bacterium]